MTELNSSIQAFECVRKDINPHAEELWLLALNSQLQLIEKEMVFRGTVDQCLIHPRDIFRLLIKHNASSFILAHNHPSNQTHPSNQDLILTKKIYQLSHLMQIPLLDHLIVSPTQYYSMADNSHMKTWRKLSFKYI